MPEPPHAPNAPHAAGRRVVPVALALAAALAAAFLVAPPLGTDLAAQEARASFFDRHGFTPIDLGWYGGVNQFGYSLVSQVLGAWFGPPVVGAVAAVVSAVAFAHLLRRTAARRPVLGAVLGAVVLVGNLVSGRITFAVGLAFGLLALATVAGTGGGRAARLPVAALLAALATWASPVAGLFVGLAGGALLLAGCRRPDGAGWRDDRWLPEALVLCLAPVVALAPMAVLFGNGGRQPFTAESMRINIALAVLVIVVLPAGRRTLRIGAALTIVLLLLAYHLPSPIGSNALRLPMLFAVPVLAGYATLGRRWLAGLLVAVVWWQPPVMTSDLAWAGAAASGADFYRPLADELRRRAPVGRVEVVPLRDHWESRHIAPVVPLARGWERQVDVDRNPLFYTDPIDPADYRDWLRDNAVSLVAVAPDSPPDRYARGEAALIATGLPYLRQVWRDQTWRLYAVDDPEPLVAAPAQLVESTAAAVRFRLDRPADVLVRVRWSRWLTLTGPGGCLAPGPDGWTRVRATAPGEQTLSSGFRPGPTC
ncbi:hypothetical protein O7627_23875 [Solwaraspora sp. WMMD1047]|uniref:hypothetical protein n=1 Tax=Solwaraspora sp. WMMD1047 TaxID=3016102 RepID=UPI002415A80A|nr:hypothetical protein [Solwaraspora sp. WMMD1047]MDG4832323.1 hypothetical protein [Solwaraspora sp. WMMD1047]